MILKHPWKYLWQCVDEIPKCVHESNWLPLKKNYDWSRKYDLRVLSSVYIIGWIFPEVSFGLRVLSLPALSVSRCVCLCSNHELARAITRHLLESPNLDDKCKTPWLRSLLFGGWFTLTFKVTYDSKVKIYPILGLSMWSITFSD